MKARAAAVWLLIAAPHAALMGCSSGNAARPYDDSVVSDPFGRQQTYQNRTERVCEPSEELAVNVAYGRVAGIDGSKDGFCAVYYPEAREVDFLVSISKPEQCTPQGLAAFGHKLPRKPPVCRIVSAY